MSAGKSDRSELERLRVTITELRRELSIARSFAWGDQHRMYRWAWFPTSYWPSDNNDDWHLPEWLTSPLEPTGQSWFIDPDANGPHEIHGLEG